MDTNSLLDELELTIRIGYTMEQPGCSPTGRGQNVTLRLSQLTTLPMPLMMPYPYSEAVKSIVISAVEGKRVKGYVTLNNRNLDFELKPGRKAEFDNIGFAYYTVGWVKISLDWINESWR